MSAIEWKSTLNKSNKPVKAKAIKQYIEGFNIIISNKWGIDTKAIEEEVR